MPYALNGVCYAEASDALRAFFSPVVSPDAITTPSTASVSPTGLITWSMHRYSLIDGSSSFESGVLQLPTCDVPNSGFNDIGLLLFCLALLFAFFNGFRTGYRP